MTSCRIQFVDALPAKLGYLYENVVAQKIVGSDRDIPGIKRKATIIMKWIFDF